MTYPSPSNALDWLTDATPPGECDLSAKLDRILVRLAEYRPQADADLVRRAFRFAYDKHDGQKRRSGEPYIIHPVEVTEVLAELEMDETTLAAGLLHDVVEDCNVTGEQLATEFGPEVAMLVDGVTKLQIVGVDEGKERPETAEDDEEMSEAALERRKKHAELAKNAANIRKIFVAMAKDLRVIIIKLADRLHNMRTLGALSPARQYRMASETLQIFAPLAHRLGIWQLKWQLEDLSFKYVNPDAYKEVSQMVARNRAERQAEVDEAIQALTDRLKDEGIHAQVKGRPKHLYSIYNKMQQQGLEFSDLFDLTALRVIVHTRAECYHALGVVSATWTPIPGMYTDYIAQSKTNLYQSLHIKVTGPSGRPVEVQIRTWEMHRTAEFGVAAHWQYKEGGKVSDQFERRLAFLRQQMFDWQNDSKNSREFMQNIADDLFSDQVFDLPVGSTPVDFAYRIHSNVGQHCVGAKVNGRMVPLSFRFDYTNPEFKNGMTVDIITRPSAAPSRDWLAFVKTSHARTRIRSYFRRLNRDENILKGREMLEKELAHQVERDAKSWGEDPRSLIKDESLRAIATSFNILTDDELRDKDLLAQIGQGTIAPSTVLNRLKPPPVPSDELHVSGTRADDRKLQIRAGGMDAENVEFRRSRCCLPIPGDEVIGYVTRGRGMALHRRECPNAKDALEHEPDRCMSVAYIGNEGQVFQVYLIIETVDRTGLLADVSNTFAENKTFITSVKTQSHRDRTATLEVAIEVRDTEHLKTIIGKVHALPDILNIHRAGPGRASVTTGVASDIERGKRTLVSRKGARSK
jgi:guanosine-3',5'-bis(diphosphate) 3'-pyrophosphohydrolase